MALLSINRFKSLLLILLVSTALILAGFILKNFKRLPDSISVDITKDGVDVGIKNFHLVEEESGQKKWELEAAEAQVLESKDMMKLKGFRVTFFQEKAGNVKLTADQGVITNKRKDMEAFGNVLVTNGELILASRTLKCESDSKRVTTQDPVEVTGKNFKVTGEGMVSHLDEEKVEILKNVKMTIYPGKN